MNPEVLRNPNMDPGTLPNESRETKGVDSAAAIHAAGHEVLQEHGGALANRHRNALERGTERATRVEVHNVSHREREAEIALRSRERARGAREARIQNEVNVLNQDYDAQVAEVQGEITNLEIEQREDERLDQEHQANMLVWQAQIDIIDDEIQDLQTEIANYDAAHPGVDPQTHRDTIQAMIDTLAAAGIPAGAFEAELDEVEEQLFRLDDLMHAQEQQVEIQAQITEAENQYNARQAHYADRQNDIDGYGVQIETINQNRDTAVEHLNQDQHNEDAEFRQAMEEYIQHGTERSRNVLHQNLDTRAVVGLGLENMRRGTNLADRARVAVARREITRGTRAAIREIDRERGFNRQTREANVLATNINSELQMAQANSHAQLETMRLAGQREHLDGQIEAVEANRNNIDEQLTEVRNTVVNLNNGLAIGVALPPTQEAAIRAAIADAEQERDDLQDQYNDITGNLAQLRNQRDAVNRDFTQAQANAENQRQQLEQERNDQIQEIEQQGAERDNRLNEQLNRLDSFMGNLGYRRKSNTAQNRRRERRGQTARNDKYGRGENYGRVNVSMEYSGVYTMNSWIDRMAASGIGNNYYNRFNILNSVSRALLDEGVRPIYDRADNENFAILQRLLRNRQVI